MIKLGVNLNGLSQQMVIAYVIAQKIFSQDRQNYDCIITSASDGKHSLKSKHYTGQAIDLRSQHIIGEPAKDKILNDLKEALPGFDVLLEDRQGSNEHFHIEWDPIGT